MNIKNDPGFQHVGDSSEQRSCEAVIKRAVESRLGISLSNKFPFGTVEPDGFCDGNIPVIVEIWSHQGIAKGSQPNKIISDAAKMVLCEKLLGKNCKKIIAVSDKNAVKHLDGKTWHSGFLKTFEIEIMVVDIPNEIRELVTKAQKRQYR